MECGNQTFNPDFILMGILVTRPLLSFSSLWSWASSQWRSWQTLSWFSSSTWPAAPHPHVLPPQPALMDLMLICTTVPKMAHSYLSGRKSISVAGCEAQIFLYVSLLGAECASCWLSWPMTAMLPFAILFSTPVSWTGNFVDSWLPLHGFLVPLMGLLS